jgi:hypothetical protein
MTGKRGSHDRDMKKQRLKRMKCKHGRCKDQAIDWNGYCELHEPIVDEERNNNDLVNDTGGIGAASHLHAETIFRNRMVPHSQN